MIQLIEVRKQFGNRLIADGINLTIPEGSITCIIGPSGEGKSVLLKQIIGLIKPTSGQILFNNVDITQLQGKQLEQIYNQCGYVFQFAALLDSLTIFENVGLPLLEKGYSPQAVLPQVIEKLALVHLGEQILYKYPSEISGGQRKRVGLARTIITNPSVILYDEPTSGLDPVTSRIVHELMQSMQQQLKTTSIVISHDVEIFKYVDYVALLYAGKIRFFGDANTIWESDNPYVYQFIRGLSEGPIHYEQPEAINSIAPLF